MNSHHIAAILLVMSCAGCSSALYGEGSLYIWNGTDEKADFMVEGRSPATASLKAERGSLFEEMVAGDYILMTTKQGIPMPPVKFTIDKDRMTVFNLDRKGCFARNDVSGMYKRGKARVRVLEIFKDQEVIQLKDLIPVKPGQRLPAEAPGLTREMVFQRFVVVPCNLIEDKDGEETKVVEFVRRLR